MANNFRYAADQLRCIANRQNLGREQRQTLRSTAETLESLEKIKCMLDAADPEDEALADEIAQEVVTLLGLKP